MKVIRFLLIDYPNPSIIENLANNLNTRQTEFQFVVHDQVMKLRGRGRTGSPTKMEELELIARRFCVDEFSEDYPVVICHSKIEGYSFARLAGDNAVITTQAWGSKPSGHLTLRYLAYALVEALMNLYLEIPVHYPGRGCVGDSWGEKKDIEIALQRCEYCTECRSLIVGAISQGKISLSESAAIFRILDYVAGRRACFVLMPFHKKFDAVYQRCLQPSLLNQKWVSGRADRVFESREIMALIWEEILRSDLIIADLSGKNPNVFYELGYAHALHKKTILITQSMKDVPFDLRHRQIIEYSATPRGLKKLAVDVVPYLT